MDRLTYMLFLVVQTCTLKLYLLISHPETIHEQVYVSGRRTQSWISECKLRLQNAWRINWWNVHHLARIIVCLFLAINLYPLISRPKTSKAMITRTMVISKDIDVRKDDIFQFCIRTIVIYWKLYESERFNTINGKTHDCELHITRGLCDIWVCTMSTAQPAWIVQTSRPRQVSHYNLALTSGRVMCGIFIQTWPWRLDTLTWHGIR